MHSYPPNTCKHSRKTDKLMLISISSSGSRMLQEVVVREIHTRDRMTKKTSKIAEKLVMYYDADDMK